MSFNYIEYSSLSLGLFGEIAQNQPVPIYFFEIELDEFSNIIQIKSTKNALIDILPLGQERSIVESIEFTLDNKIGCEQFKITLNENPKIYIPQKSIISITINGERFYIGEVNSVPEETENKKNKIEISGVGLYERLKKNKIVNPFKYQIQNIIKSGTNIIITTATTIDITGLGGNLNGLKCIVKDSDDQKNNGVETIISFTSNTVTVSKPSGISTSNPIGTLSILPPTWSNSSLVSDVVKYTIDKFLPKDVIQYDVNKIETTAGVLTLGAIDFDGFTFDKFFETIRKILDGNSGSKYRFYIDEFGYVVLSKIKNDIIDKFFIGYQINDYDIKYDHSTIANSVVVMRQKARSGVGNGFRQAGFSQDLTSINKIGLEEHEEQVPGYFSDSLGQAYANAILQARLNPKISMNAKNVKFKKYEFGKYGVVSQFDNYTTTLHECDSLSGWTIDSNINATVDSSELVDGAACLRFDFNQNANGESVFYTFSNERIAICKKIIFYIKANTVGSYIKFGIGETAFNQYLFDINIIQQSYFSQFVIDVSNLSLNKIKYFGLLFHSLNPNNYIVKLDFVTLEEYSTKHFEFPLKKVKYYLNNKGNYCDLSFGENIANQNLSEFLGGVKAQIEITKLNLKE